MNEQIHVTQVGAPDPEKATSPIIEEGRKDQEVDELDTTAGEACMFNGTHFAEGMYVCSGNELLCCRQGHWVQSGSCDPDNP